MSIKRVIIMMVLATVAWYGVDWYMNYQKARGAYLCAQEIDMPNQLKAVKSDDQARALAGRLLDCMEDRIGFPSSLFFDKKAAMESFGRR